MRQKPNSGFDCGHPPRLVELYACSGCTVEGLVLRNPPYWTFHIVYSDNITVKDVKVLAPTDSPNTDAVDIDSSTDVEIDGLYCYNGDDCIAVKSAI